MFDKHGTRGTRQARGGRQALGILLALALGVSTLLSRVPSVAQSTLQNAPQPLATGGFVPPLQVPLTLTSTFGEYRTGHFHAGIDLATLGKSGVPVLAVRSGYVHRLRASGSGYGNTVVLRLDNGMVALYAHLDGFSEKIQSVVRAEQMARENYEVDFFPVPFSVPVSAGDTVGFSGNTGASNGPHLHLELREGEVAVNPLCGFFEVDDGVPPSFRFLQLTSVGKDSEIDGLRGSVVFNLRRGRGGGGYTSQRVPVLSGRFFVSASVFDGLAAGSGRGAVYDLRLFLDDSLVFGNRYTRIESSRTHEVELAYDFGRARTGERFVHNLCRFAGSKSGLFETTREGSGFIDTDVARLSGRHIVRVEARDIKGNTSSAELEFVVNRRPRVKAVELRDEGHALAIEADVEDAEGEIEGVYADLAFGSTKAESRHITFVRDETRSGSSGGRAYRAEARLPRRLAASGDDVAGVLRVWAVDGAGSSSSFFTKTIPGSTNAKDVTAELVVTFAKDHGEVTAKIAPFFLRPRIGVADGDTTWLEVEERSGGVYVARFTLSPGLAEGGKAVCVVERGDSPPVTRSAPLLIHAIRKGWKGTLWGEGGAFGIAYGPQSFYHDVYVSIEKGEKKGLPLGLEFAGEVFRVAGGSVVFDEPCRLIMRCDTTVRVEDRVGLYRREAGGAWVFVGAVVDTTARTVQAEVRNFCDFTLLRDTAAPVISIVNPRGGATLSTSTPRLQARVSDTGSGMTWQGTSVKIDGKKVLSVWDPKFSLLSVVHHEPLSAGPHTVLFEARDRAGNVSTRAVLFRTGE
ncbi:MAG: peptidoglycan DD-metalloendopeptidase family protein [Candidatus Eisenbacteria bacterium]